MPPKDEYYAAAGFQNFHGARRSRRESARARRAHQAAAARQHRETARVGQLEAAARSITPAAGPARPRAMRMPYPARPLAHRETSRNLAALYPFIADGGHGITGAFIGNDIYSGEPFTFDPWNLYTAGVISNPNGIIFGDLGGGKSSTAKAMVARSLLFGRRATVASDPKGEWTPLTQAIDGTVIRLAQGGSTRLNMLDAGHRPATNTNGQPLTEGEWHAMARASRLSLVTAITNSLLPEPMDPITQAVLDAAIDHVVTRSHGRPRLPELVDQLLVPDPAAPIPPGIRDHEHVADAGRLAGQALRRLTGGDLAGLFDDHSTIAFDPSTPITSVDLSALGPGHAGIHIAQTCTSAWVEAAVRDPAGGKRWIIYDEGWTMFNSAPLLARMREQWKLSRAWGLSNWLIAHRPTDVEVINADTALRGLARGLLEDADLRIIHRLGTDMIHNLAATTELSTAEAATIAGLDQGVAIWRIKNRPAVIRTLLTDYEHALFDTNIRMTA